MSVSGLIDDLDALVGSRPERVADLYDRLAPSYERFRRLWIRLAGGGAEQAMLEDLRATLRPGARVLDAGAGTGVLSREILALEPEAEVTMVDVSPGMLEQASQIPAERINADLAELPFDDGSFDVAVSAWVIETVEDPLRAASELLRVLDPQGHLFLTFTALPGGWLSRAGSGLLREIVENRFAGRALPDEHVPWHDCGRSHRRRFAAGLTEEIALRKCCEIPPSVASAAAEGTPRHP